MTTVRVRKFHRWWDGLRLGWRALIAGFSSALTFATGSIMEQYIQTAATMAGMPTIAIRVLSAMVLILIATAAVYALGEALRRGRDKSEKRRDAIVYAASRMDQEMTDEIAIAEKDDGNRACATCDPESSRRAMEIIDRVVSAVFQLFEAQFGESFRVDERVEFEVTFMTPSYRDKNLTIAAYSNRHRRRPLSLANRAQRPEIYDSTIAAQLYRTQTPTVRIIEDTSKSPEYIELYVGQKSRIRSLVVFPVRSSMNVLLGALVVHCNRAGFFAIEDEGFIEELLEVFAKRIALQRLILDRIWKGTPSQSPPF